MAIHRNIVGYRRMHTVGPGFRPPAAQEPSGNHEPVYGLADAHEIVVGPTGSGKTISRIVPRLLEHAGPVIALDVKGELYQTTAVRRMALGQQVLAVDPFGILGEDLPGARFDPAQRVRDADDPMAAAWQLADALNPLSQLQSREPFWAEAGNALNAAGIAYTCWWKHLKEMDEAHLPGWHDLLFAEDTVYQIALALDNAPDLPATIRRPLAAFLQTADITRSGILVTAQNSMRMFSQPAIRKVTRGNDISLQDLRSAKPMSIYICIPPHAISAYGAILRFWFDLMLATLLERSSIPAQSTLVVIDEAGAIGRIPAMETAFAMGRGYGVQVLAAVQTLHQLSSTYGPAHRNLTDNAGDITILPPNGAQTATELSTLAGSISAERILAMADDDTLLIQRRRVPEILRRRDCLNDLSLRSLAAPNPRHGRGLR